MPIAFRVIAITIAVATALVAVAPSVSVAGNPHGAERGRRLGDLEKMRVDRALAALGLVVSDDPEGRTICALHVITEEIFVPDEASTAWLTWLNALHSTTRESTVRRALTFAEGDPWREIDVLDSERVLRDRGLFSVVAIVPVEDPGERCLGALVLVRDQWSLHPSWNVRLSGNAVTHLSLSLNESNFLGRNVSLWTQLQRDPGRHSIGSGINLPTVGSRRLYLQGEGWVFLGRDGRVEGTRSNFSIARPLRSVSDRRGWNASAVHWHSIHRRFFNGDLSMVDVHGSEGTWVMPERWRQTGFSVDGQYTFAMGEGVRHRVSAGPYLQLDEIRLLDVDTAGVPASVVETFLRERTPRGGRAVGPQVSWLLYEDRFLRLQNVQRFGVMEEERLGWNVSVALSASEPGLGASRQYLSSSASLRRTMALGQDAWVRVGVSGFSRQERGNDWLRTGASLRAVFPETLAGRIHLYSSWMAHWKTPLRAPQIVGASSPMRGWPDGWIRTRDVGLVNLEWRSRPMRVLGSRLGAAVFSDTAVARGGDIDHRWQAWSAVGIGARAWVPQLMASMWRADLAMPLDGTRRGPQLTMTMGQPF